MNDLPASASMPNVFELIAVIKDLHLSDGDTCRECGQAVPCRANAYVDGVLASRFEDDTRDDRFDAEGNLVRCVCGAELEHVVRKVLDMWDIYKVCPKCVRHYF